MKGMSCAGPGAVQSLSSCTGALCCPCPQPFPLVSLLVLEPSTEPRGDPTRALAPFELQKMHKHPAHDFFESLPCCGHQQGLCNNSGALWHLLFTHSSSLLLLLLLVTWSPIRSDSPGRLLDIMSKKIICRAGRWVFGL